MLTSTAALTATGLAAGLPAGPAVLAGPESDKAGPLGLLTIVLLGIAVYFLYRSMVRHMKKVPASFDRPASKPPTDRPAGAPPTDQPAADQPAGGQGEPKPPAER